MFSGVSVRATRGRQSQADQVADAVDGALPGAGTSVKVMGVGGGAVQGRLDGEFAVARSARPSARRPRSSIALVITTVGSFGGGVVEEADDVRVEEGLATGEVQLGEPCLYGFVDEGAEGVGGQGQGESFGEEATAQ